MHVDVAVRAELGAFPAADAPVLDDDLEVFLPADRTDRALRHAKRVATGTTRRCDEEMIVAQPVAKQAGDSVVRFRAGLDARVAAGAVVEIDEQQVLGFEQTLVQIIVEPQAGRSDAAAGSRHPRIGDGLDLRAHAGKLFEHQVEFGSRNLHDIGGIQRGAGRDPFDRAQ